MKIAIPFAILALSLPAFAGQEIVSTSRISETESSHCHRFSCKLKSAGSPGTYHRSNFSHNAVVLINDTPEFVTFFVYSGDLCGPNDVNNMIEDGAQVYEVVVPPFQTSFTDRRGRYYWVGTTPGKWGIDLARHHIVRL